MGVASQFNRGVVLLADLHGMEIEVGVAFSCWLLSVTVGEELGDRS